MAYLVGDDGKYYSKRDFELLDCLYLLPHLMEDAKFERLMDLLEYSGFR